MGLRKERGIIANLIWCLKQLCKYKKEFIGVFLIESIVRGISPVVSLVLIQQIIDMLQYKTDKIDQIIIKLLILSVFQLLCGISLNYIQLALKNWELEYDAHFQASILNKISILDSKDFENTETYNLINRTQYDGNAGILGTIKTMFSLTSAVVSMVSYAVIIIKYNILIFVLIILIPIIRYFFEKNIRSFFAVFHCPELSF